MSVLNVRTKGSALIVEKSSRITSGGRNAVKLRVVFDEAWDCTDGKYSASFYVTNPEDACTVELTRNSDGSYGCNIPYEVILNEGYFHFGVWCESEEMLKPSDIKVVRVYRGIVTNGRTPTIPEAGGNTGGNTGGNVNVDLSNYVTKDMLPKNNIDDIFEKIDSSVNLYQPVTEGWVDNTSIYADGSTKENANFCLTGKIPVEPNTTYSVNGWDKGWFFCYDSNDNYIGYSMTNSESGDIPFGYGTTKENTAYIRFNISKDTDLETTIEKFNAEFMLVEGIGISVEKYGFKVHIREIGDLSQIDLKDVSNLVGAINSLNRLDTNDLITPSLKNEIAVMSAQIVDDALSDILGSGVVE